MAPSASDRMDFEPTPEQRRLMELAASFAGDAVTTLPQDAARFATKACAALGARRLFETRATLDAALVVTELSRASLALGTVFATGWLFLDALRRHGESEALGAIARGVETGTFAASVVGLPARGNDETLHVAGDAAGALLLSGATEPAPLVPMASHAVIAAGSRENAVLACVDLSAKTVTKASPTPSLGLEELPRGALELRRAAVPREHVLVTGPAALEASRALSHAKNILTAAAAVGVAGRALDRALSHARASGKLSQSTEFVVSDLATGYDAAFLATARAAWSRDEGADVAAESAGAKLLAARTATELCHGTLRVCGEAGYGDDLRRAYLDARHLELYDGAEAEQIDVIASEMLGES